MPNPTATSQLDPTLAAYEKNTQVYAPNVLDDEEWGVPETGINVRREFDVSSTTHPQPRAF
ncbi:MAG: hypothetical protein M1833_007045 [Piccolia ochrophora]|nr:MAG: hypothetical protein M1833_007045 [Piccolia ochrophora]